MQQLLNKPISRLSTDTFFDSSQKITNYYRYLLNYASNRVRDEELAKDLVQESFLAALEHAHTFNNNCSEQTWLVAILKNKIADYYRKKSCELLCLTMLYTATNYEMSSTQHDLLPLLDRAVQMLPQLWQAVFKMKHVYDQPTAIICQKLNLTASNYWVISFRTRSKLRISLNRHL